MPAVLLKLRAELRGEHGFNPVAQNNQEDTQHAAPAVNGNSGADCRQVEPGIDGMAKTRVRPGADQFVIFLDRDAGAPVLAQMPACPQRQRDSGSGERDAGHSERIGAREESKPEKPDFGMVAEKQNEAHNLNEENA